MEALARCQKLEIGNWGMEFYLIFKFFAALREIFPASGFQFLTIRYQL